MWTRCELDGELDDELDGELHDELDHELHGALDVNWMVH